MDWHLRKMLSYLLPLSWFYLFRIYIGTILHQM